ncbi:MAG TPA: acyl carrier protein [Thermoguttaceae bacterium]|nr:acyl carrier protein [Thermoguttaceae bacterium]
MTVTQFLDVVCEALGREPGSLLLDDTPQSVEQWDSIGHLSIISTVDEALGVEVDDEEMRTFTSIRELTDRLIAKNAFED